ncbi:hypothetical protein CEXT_742901 [Caerostris extrusa]|uniref:Uncharacterized protein n=1 Tax=Caerostris extrusa TaxID=172846 RepID=A0AAV4VHM3_CAEEX|nr:hypothetical protein CEXT_742901 [Caerostris extrusa]
MTTCKYLTTDSENSSRKGAFFSVIIYYMESESPESLYIFIYKVIQWILNYYKLLPADSMVPPSPCYANLQPDETVAMTTQEMTLLHLFLSLFLPVLVCQKFANPFPAVPGPL